MIAIFDFIPSHCPACGKNIRPYGSFPTADYLEGASHTCSCGVHYQFIKTESLLEVAEQEGSDMAFYIGRQK